MVHEINTVKKKLRRGMLRVAILYPSTYEAALSSLAFHLLYFYINERYDEVYAERFTLPSSGYSASTLRSLDTGSPLRDFDVVIASIHYEPDYSKLVQALTSSGIEVLRTRRSRPVVLVGGPAPMSNPMPLADIVDGVFIGEAEGLVPVAIDLALQYRGNKKSLLEVYSSKKGFYIPGFTERAERVILVSMDRGYYPIKQIQSVDAEPVYGKGFLLEVSRGCPLWCRFCLEGRLFKPYRHRGLAEIKDMIRRGLSINNLNRVIVYSLFFPEQRDKHVLEYLCSNRVKASLPSMRLDKIDSDLLELIRCLGQKMITIAPENVSEKARLAFAKGFSRVDLEEKPAIILDHGLDLKIYLVVGFKGETLDDVKENISYIRRIARIARKRGKGISVTVNPLVPKPKTPFQWIGMASIERARGVIAYIRRELGGVVDTRPLYVNWAWMQASIALGGQGISRTIIAWSILGGGLGAWRRALRETGYSTAYVFTGYRYGERLPWDVIRVGERVEEVAEVEYGILRRNLGLNDPLA